VKYYYFIDCKIYEHSCGLLNKGGGQCNEAIEYFEKSLDIREHFSSQDSLYAFLYHNLRNVYLNHDDGEKALLYYNRTLEIPLSKIKSDGSELAYIYNNIRHYSIMLNHLSFNRSHYRVICSHNKGMLSRYRP
jgi:tetratricopeptide (TPR) repeat protein